MRLLGVALLGLIVGCGGGTPPVTPPPEPPPGTLYALIPSQQPIPCGVGCNQSPKIGEFWLAKGQNTALTIKAEQRSILTKKIRLEISASGFGLGVSVTDGKCTFDNEGRCILEGSNSAILTVTLDPSVPDNDVPYFYIFGYPLDANGNPLADQIRLDYRWNLAKPPTAP